MISQTACEGTVEPNPEDNYDNDIHQPQIDPLVSMTVFIMYEYCFGETNTIIIIVFNVSMETMHPFCIHRHI